MNLTDEIIMENVEELRFNYGNFFYCLFDQDVPRSAYSAHIEIHLNLRARPTLS